ncbi:MAG: glycoside hydrolase family 3 C-terminal domain-containing protein, partial [Ignavibacteriaceae bacterium]
ELYLSDATQGIHIRRDLPDPLEKSTAFPAPICLTSTWNTKLARDYAKSIGEECRAGGIAVLLGPGMNICRISQCGRNFEYFGEDPFLASRMIENYVAGVQSTGTIATLKHFVCNNTDYHRRTSNSIVDERTLHEIYLPAFKAGADAGAMAVMTSYNKLNGEWCGQSEYAIKHLLRKELGFKWLVMTDWWSVYDPVKVIKSGQDLEMPGVGMDKLEYLGDIYVKSNSKKLLEEKKISKDDINRMAKDILRTEIAMGLLRRKVKNKKYLHSYSKHEKIALQTAREGIVLLKNENKILPIKKSTRKKILLTGNYVNTIAKGGGSAEVEGYNSVTMLDALKIEFPGNIDLIENPTDEQVRKAGIVILSIGTDDSEGWDRPFELPNEEEQKIIRYTKSNSHIVIVVNSGGGIKMTDWSNQAAAIIYSWYPGQNGNKALAEIISGKINPSGKLPITIEKEFKDSPGCPYIPAGEKFYANWEDDADLNHPVNDIKYEEGVFAGYRWYESKNIEPLYHFGFGLSYTKFKYSNLKIAKKSFKKGDKLKVEFSIKNSGKAAGSEIAQIYIHDVKASVPRPVKELKSFQKVFLKPGESKKVSLVLKENDFAFWDISKHGWYAEPGYFYLFIGSSSNDIHLHAKIKLFE